jgi:alpha-amylase
VSGNVATVTVPADDAVAIDVNSRASGSPAATFTVNVNADVTTTYGQNVYIVGSIPALGSWNTADAIALSSRNYPSWTGTLSFPTNTYFEYKYIKIDASGNVTWESGANRYYTTGSSGSITFNDTWHS